MYPSANGGTPVNSFALVTYIPGRLGAFLDRIRQELVPSCALQSHVSLLPPRPLPFGMERAAEQLRDWADRTAPVRVEATDIGVFENTKVVYIELGAGSNDLRRMHDELNTAALEFKEPYTYHPHITLAQEFAPADVRGMEQLARRKWKEFQYERHFMLDSVSFVQNTIENVWRDLMDFPLGQAETARRR